MKSLKLWKAIWKANTRKMQEKGHILKKSTWPTAEKEHKKSTTGAAIDIGHFMLTLVPNIVILQI